MNIQGTVQVKAEAAEDNESGVERTQAMEGIVFPDNELGLHISFHMQWAAINAFLSGRMA